MEFYKIWSWRGTIGVNKLDLGDMIKVELITIAIFIALAGLFVMAMPTLFFVWYVLWMLFSDSGDGWDGKASLQRLWVNIFTIVSSVYYLIDFHFGWFSYQITSSVMSRETLDAVASYNLAIGLISVFMFFIGHEIYRSVEHRLLRIVGFLLVIYFLMKWFIPVGDYVVEDLITQVVPEIIVEN